MISYSLIRSKRKTISLQVSREAEVIVRAPKWVPKWQIDSFVASKEAWILKHMEEAGKRGLDTPERRKLGKEEFNRIRKLAKYSLPIRTDYFANLMGVTYNRISVRNQKTRWGSCSAEGNLNFHMMLIMMPEEIRDYVIIHELCHRKYMNHSKQFWEEVGKYDPEFRIHRKWLKEHGSEFQVYISEK